MSGAVRKLLLAGVAGFGILGVVLLQASAGAKARAAASDATAAYTPAYAKDGSLTPPAHYREWIYLTSGLDMSYTPQSSPDMHMFDNVFVNPEAYRSFMATGTWPDKTVMVLESRGASSQSSINKSGHFQSGAPMGLEVHVKDASRFPGGWAFFSVENESKATIFPQTARCYSCHADHAAVDTTFVQFYPTLLPVAQSKGTLSAKYKQETAAEGGK
ncbi:MAG TPA: cytochrome P460 family protein [Acidobacteriaceae bacterium]